VPADQRPADPGTPVGRRVVLGLLGLGALGVVGGARLQSGLNAVLAPVELRDPTGLVGLLPLGDTFRYYSVTGGVTEQTADDYRLGVSGLVRQPARHSLADLQAMPQTELVRDFQCVTGWRVPDVPWAGVRLGHLLDLAGPAPEATAVRLTSFDGTYTESLTLEQARRDDVLVALRMLGAPVTHDHGGPVRLYVAPMYGYKSVKWLSGIEVTDAVVPGYWEHRGYDVNGFVGRSNGRSGDERT
jgi:DMSO/TMAO reductase YedYZ molybdopterin-dependent catalytic subunit